MTDFQPDPNWGDGEALKARFSKSEIIKQRRMAVKVLMAPAENQRLFDLVDPEIFAIVQIESQELITEAMEALSKGDNKFEFLFGKDRVLYKQLIERLLLRAAETPNPKAFAHRAMRLCPKTEISHCLQEMIDRLVDISLQAERD